MHLDELAISDKKYQIHSLHHPLDEKDALICASGEGIYIRDPNGKEFIDGLSGLWNVNIGHGRTEVAEAAAEQMKTLAYYSGYAGSTTIPSIELAERLIRLRPEMGAVYFTSGGSEANETAFKTARYYWKVRGKSDKIKIISRIHGYHGVTLQAMSATGIAGYWKMFEPRAADFNHIATCYPYRFEANDSELAPGEAAAQALEEEIVRWGPETVAAFIAEPIHGAGGIIYPTDDYWPRVREICTRHNILLIADEIVTGFGRTGRWFGLDHWNVQPDILTFAKGVTSGYLPLGGMMVSGEIKEAMDSVDPARKWMHGYTYSGHPTCCAVALKNIEILEREKLPENAARMGNLLLKELENTFGDHPNAGDIRGGKGLLAAIEFVEDRPSKRNFAAERNFSARLRAEMRDRGLMTRTRPVIGAHPAPGDVAFFAPPLLINEEEVHRMVNIVEESVDAVLRS
jgi:putrescine---pyruvate transaminase